MKRWLLLSLGILGIIVYSFNWHQSISGIFSPTPSSKYQKHSPKVIGNFVTRKIVRGSVNRPKRTPSSIRGRDHKKKPVDVVLSKNPIKIGKNFQVVDGIAGLEKAKYKSSLGKKILENEQYVFFKPAMEVKEAWPVALDSVNQKLFPISHVLHIKGVDADLRAQFKSEGMHEYYYNTRLKFMFLETSPTTVLQQFQKLTARGFDVRLEVLKDPPVSK